MTPSNLLVVLDVGTTVTEDGDHLPTAVVDASNTPEVADLARVHAIEGVGDVSTVAQSIEIEGVIVLLLGVRLTTPVTAAFTLAFDRTAHAAFLEAAASAGRVAIATTGVAGDTTFDGERSRPLWLAVDLDGDALRAAVHASPS